MGIMGEYKSYFTSLFIIIINQNQNFSLSKVFFIPKKLTMYLHIELILKVGVICVSMLRVV
jgi:hypothetical protein